MGTEKRPPGLMLYFDKMRPIISLLTAEERGDLLLKMLDYAEYGTEPNFHFGDRLQPVWEFVRQAIDHDTAAYQEKCAQKRKAAQARWNKEGNVKNSTD